jgi:hypothetical protein
MKHPALRFLFIPSVLGAGACAVPVDIERGTIEIGDQRTPNQASTAAGIGYRVKLFLSRNSASHLVRYQLYSYIHVVDCSTNRLEYAVFPHLGDAAGDNFQDMQEAIDQSRDELVALSGEFTSSADFLNHSHCLTLDGGSYLGHKIDAPIIRSELPATAWR